MREFTKRLKTEAAQLGFVLSGITPAATPARFQQFLNWLDAGFAGGMAYLENRRDAYQHPKHVLDGCRSIVMLAVPYDGQPASQSTSNATESTGRIARYAGSGIDYHDVIHKRLKSLKRWTLDSYPNAMLRGVVDTAPLLEREFAEAAGLGWVGKNTLLLNRQWGSYFFLAALLTDLELTADAPYEKGYCGTCTACLTACPTEAFPRPFVLDAGRCISYLTIEHREHIPEPLRDQLAGWAFGCDVCQEVCPWNRKEHPVDAEFHSQYSTLDLIETLELSEDQFRERYRHSAMWRTKREGLVRNAILLVGTRRIQRANNQLLRLLEDESQTLRAAAAWALERTRPQAWRAALGSRLAKEHEPDVVAALKRSLAATS